MNASSGKVLKEARFGLLIMELDMRGSRIRKGGYPETKGFQDGVDLRLDAIKAD